VAGPQCNSKRCQLLAACQTVPTDESLLLQKVAYMDKKNKQDRISIYKNLGFGGWIDWAVDLQTFQEKPPNEIADPGAFDGHAKCDDRTTKATKLRESAYKFCQANAGSLAQSRGHRSVVTYEYPWHRDDNTNDGENALDVVVFGGVSTTCDARLDMVCKFDSFDSEVLTLQRIPALAFLTSPMEHANRTGGPRLSIQTAALI
jgi:hypothetical protein